MNVAAREIDPSDFFDVLPALRMDLDADLDVDPDSLRVAARTYERGVALVAHGTLTHGRLEAHAALDTERAAFEGFRVEGGHAAADVAGPLDDLHGRLWARLAGVSRGPFALDDLQVLAEGTSQSLNVEVAGGGGTLDVLELRALVEPRAPLRVADLSARVERAGQSVGVKAPEIVVNAPAVDVPQLEIQGLGKPIDADVHYAPGRLRARLTGPDVDLAPLSGILTSTSGRIAGRGAIDVDIDASLRATRATARLRLVNAKYASWPEVAVLLDLDVDGARAQGRLQLDNVDLGTAALDAELDAGRPITSWKSLENAQGNVIIDTDRVPIERICLVFHCPEVLAASTASVVGTVGARLEVSRTAPPNRTKGEDTKVTLEIAAHDTDGRLAYLSAGARLDLASALALKRVPVDAPIEARFGLEARSFDRLPPVLRPLPLSGLLSMHGYAEGTITQPFLVVEVAGSDLKIQGAARDTPPLELGWVTTYDLEDAASDIDVRMGAAHVVRATLQVNATVPQLLGAPGERPWSGGLYAEVDRLPLKLLPVLAEKEASGALSGGLSVSGIHEAPVVASHLSIDDLRFGDEVVGPVAVSLEANGQTCVASLEAGGPNQPARATLRARAGCRWKNGAIPALLSEVPAEIALDAQEFPIIAVQPLVSEVFGRLRGSLDAHLTASGHPDQGVGRWAVRGEAHLRDASLLPLVLGREINRLDMQATADGSGVVRVPHFSGEMGAGAFTGQGTLVLRDNSVDHAQAELHVAKRKAIPVTMEGVSYGTVWGDVIGDARVADGQLMLNLRAPTLRLELPPQRTGNLERLDHNPAVVVLQPLSAAPPTTAVGGGPAPPGPRVPRVVASVELGGNVGVSRDDLKIDLTTPPAPQNPKISLDGDVTIDGSIRILGGRVPVAGRVFRVERGVVQFGGSDPADPALDVDAVYEGPDTSITIKVHVGGTAKDAKITLQSTPAKSQAEILAILTFGEAAPASSGPSGISGPQQGTNTIAGAAGSAAAGVGSAIVTTGLNQVLSQSIIPIRTSVSAGTSSTASAAASIDVSERLRFEYIRSFGTPSQVGQQIDDNQFAVDWRFKSRWMLRTIVGTRGTAALDLLWQRWY
jgi:phage baseplate assembly protein gpV